MRGRDLIGLSLSGFHQARLRTALTLAGVLLGSAMLGVSLSLGHGLRQYVEEEFLRQDRLRTLIVYRSAEPPPLDESAIPAAELVIPDTVGPDRRERLRKRLVQKWHDRQPRRPATLTAGQLAEIARLDHVAAVRPEVFERVEATVGKTTRSAVLEALPVETAAFAAGLAFGRLPEPDRREVLVSEGILFDWGVVADADVERFVGTTLRVAAKSDERNLPYHLLNLLGAAGVRPSADELKALNELADRLPAALDRLDLPPAQAALVQGLIGRARTRPTGGPGGVAGDFTVVGVHYPTDAGEPTWWGTRVGSADLVAPVGPVQELLGGLPRYTDTGYDRAVVTADNERNVRAVVEGLKRLGLRSNSLVEWADRASQEVALIAAGMAVLSTLALVVAGLGITNTMATSVLERTHDIGIMKAVGARDREVLGLFLLEGAVVGLAGGLLGLCVAWLASYPAEGWIRGVLEQQSRQKVTATVFRFPTWLVVSVPLFALLLTTLAAALPARRAARIDPAVTLRNE